MIRRTGEHNWCTTMPGNMPYQFFSDTAGSTGNYYLFVCEFILHDKTEHHPPYFFLLYFALQGNQAVLSFPTWLDQAVSHNVSEKDRKSTRLNSSHVAISYAV